MTYVRRYLPSDFDQVVAVAERFHGESPVHSPYPFDHERVKLLLDQAMGESHWLPLVAVDFGQIIGIMLCFHMPMFFSDRSEIGDLAFYVVPDRRGTRAAMLLLHEMEKWARGQKATVIRLGVTTGIRDEAVEKFLAKNGYARVGVLTQKIL